MRNASVVTHANAPYVIGRLGSRAKEIIMPTASKKPAAQNVAQPATQHPTQLASETIVLSVEVPAPPEKPFLRFYHSDLLRSRTLAICKTLEQAQDSTQHRAALSAIVLELTDSGMEYFFLRPLQLARVNTTIERSARMGIGGIKQLITPVIRNTIGHMDKEQLLVICKHIRSLME